LKKFKEISQEERGGGPWGDLAKRGGGGKESAIEGANEKG